MFDPEMFKNTITASGVGIAEFLLRRDGLSELAGGSPINPHVLSLATLFPDAAVLTLDQKEVTGATGQHLQLANESLQSETE